MEDFPMGERKTYAVEVAGTKLELTFIRDQTGLKDRNP